MRITVFKIGSGEIRAGKLLAVKVLLIAACGDRYRLAPDRERTVIHGYTVAVIVTRIGEFIRKGIIFGIRRIVILHAFRGRGDRHRITGGQCEHFAGGIGINLRSVVCYRVGFILVILTVVCPARRRG